MPEQAKIAAPATAADLMRPPLTTVEQQAHVAAAAYLMRHAGNLGLVAGAVIIVLIGPYRSPDQDQLSAA
jgi:hypothetical protein